MIKSLALEPFIPYIKLTMVSIFFGGIFVAGRILAGNVTPSMAAFLRFVIATTILLILMIWKEIHFPIPSFKQFIGLTALGLTGICGYNLCLLTGLETVSPSRSAVIVATNPIFITLLSVLFFGEPLTRRKVIGIALSVSGAMIVASQGRWDTLIYFTAGDLFIIIGALCWALYSVIGRYVLTSLSPLVSVTYASILGLVMLFPIALYSADFQSIRYFDVTAWLAILYMSLFGTVCALLFYYQGIQAIGVVRAGAFINFVPVSTIILAMLILNEPIDTSIIIGIIVAITGVFIVNSQQKQIVETNT